MTPATSPTPVSAPLPTVPFVALPRIEQRLPEQDVLGVRHHALRRAQVIDLIDTYIAQRLPRQICLSNAYSVAVAQADTEFRDVLNASDVVLADGMSIVWGSRWVGL